MMIGDLLVPGTLYLVENDWRFHQYNAEGQEVILPFTEPLLLKLLGRLPKDGEEVILQFKKKIPTELFIPFPTYGITGIDKGTDYFEKGGGSICPGGIPPDPSRN